MHLHSATTVDGRDRKRLERVCRYLLRPPFADGIRGARLLGVALSQTRVDLQDLPLRRLRR